MKKLMSLLLCLMVMMLCLPASGVADASDLKWGMTKDEVISVMGNGIEPVSEGTDTSELDYSDQPVSQYTGLLGLFFMNDYLFAKAYLIDEDEQMSVYKSLSGELEGEYGQPGNELSFTMDAFNMILHSTSTQMDQEDLETTISGLLSQDMMKSWEIDQDNGIMLIFSGTNTALFYFQPSYQIPE